MGNPNASLNLNHKQSPTRKLQLYGWIVEKDELTSWWEMAKQIILSNMDEPITHNNLHIVHKYDKFSTDKIKIIFWHEKFYDWHFRMTDMGDF